MAEKATFYLVIDFETTGIGKDAQNGYKPYSEALMPLPRPNYPVQLACELLDASGNVVQAKQMLIEGATRLDPWVQRNCPQLSVKDCEREGIGFADAIKVLADVVGDHACTMVAHNIQYDWKEVMLYTARDMNLEHTPSFQKLTSLPQYCTCINDEHKRAKTAYYLRKLKKWIGPKLSALAKQCNVAYDETAAHDAAYDVRVTSECLRSKIQQMQGKAHEVLK